MEEKFYQLASFEYAADVQIIKGKLESEGIPVFLRDENTLNSDPLISNAIGGVKLQVYSKDKERALAIYNEVRAYALDENDQPIVCPNCKASRSEVYYNRKGVFYKLFPFFEKRKYKCLNCGIITNPRT
jgi:DNA-directed RNA polymerase subunit RPC12/RpoP